MNYKSILCSYKTKIFFIPTKCSRFPELFIHFVTNTNKDKIILIRDCNLKLKSYERLIIGTYLTQISNKIGGYPAIGNDGQ